MRPRIFLVIVAFIAAGVLLVILYFVRPIGSASRRDNIGLSPTLSPTPAAVDGFINLSTHSASDNTDLTDWLRESACAPPCWEGIMPGLTSASDVYSILAKAQFVRDITTDETNTVGEINWTWGENNRSGRVLYRPSDPEKIVYAIDPGLDCQTRLGDIAKVYGTPSHVWIKELSLFEGITTGQPSIYSYNFVWIDRGFSFSVNDVYSVLNENFRVFGPVFFAPSIDGYIAYEGQAGSFLKAWQGYAELEKYLIIQP